MRRSFQRGESRDWDSIVVSSDHSKDKRVRIDTIWTAAFNRSVWGVSMIGFQFPHNVKWLYVTTGTPRPYSMWVKAGVDLL